MTVTYEEKLIMAKELSDFRNRLERYGVPQRQLMEYYPFSFANRLFGTDYFPCDYLGKQLVLKIVDELLDV